MAKTRRTLELEENHIKWFKEHYPGTSIYWWIDHLMESFIKSHDTYQVQLAILGANEVKKQLESFYVKTSIEPK